MTTTANGGPYAPDNVVAIWVEDAQGNFVKTIGRWSASRTQHLVAWRAKAGTNDVDAVSGATRQNHNTALTVTWNLRDRNNLTVPDGTYTIRMELADSNANQATQNRQGTFTVVKGPDPTNQTGLASNGFINVTIAYAPNANTCGNGAVDDGEACDGANCPATCAASTDACVAVALTGNAATCTAACTPSPITACVDGDGCCPDACDGGTDADCAGAGFEGADNEITSGCTAGPAGGELSTFGLLGALLVLVRRRRR